MKNTIDTESENQDYAISDSNQQQRLSQYKSSSSYYELYKNTSNYLSYNYSQDEQEEIIQSGITFRKTNNKYKCTQCDKMLAKNYVQVHANLHKREILEEIPFNKLQEKQRITQKLNKPNCSTQNQIPTTKETKKDLIQKGKQYAYFKSTFQKENDSQLQDKHYQTRKIEKELSENIILKGRSIKEMDQDQSEKYSSQLVLEDNKYLKYQVQQKDESDIPIDDKQAQRKDIGRKNKFDILRKKHKSGEHCDNQQNLQYSHQIIQPQQEKHKQTDLESTQLQSQNLTEENQINLSEQNKKSNDNTIQNECLNQNKEMRNYEKQRKQNHSQTKESQIDSNYKCYSKNPDKKLQSDEDDTNNSQTQLENQQNLQQNQGSLESLSTQRQTNYKESQSYNEKDQEYIDSELKKREIWKKHIDYNWFETYSYQFVAKQNFRQSYSTQKHQNQNSLHKDSNQKSQFYQQNRNCKTFQKVNSRENNHFKNTTNEQSENFQKNNENNKISYKTKQFSQKQATEHFDIRQKENQQNYTKESFNTNQQDQSSKTYTTNSQVNDESNCQSFLRQKNNKLQNNAKQLFDYNFISHFTEKCMKLEELILRKHDIHTNIMRGFKAFLS